MKTYAIVSWKRMTKVRIVETLGEAAYNGDKTTKRKHDSSRTRTVRNEWRD